MKGIVKNVSDFLEKDKWLFIVEDAMKIEYFIMDDSFYKRSNLKSPVTKRELDSLDKGMQIEFDYKEINNVNLVTKILW
jgi:hypothetical protein